MAEGALRRLIALGVPAAPLVSGFCTEAGRVESGRRPRAADRPDGRRWVSPRGRWALVDALQIFSHRSRGARQRSLMRHGSLHAVSKLH
jgi:hypothetical protein